MNHISENETTPLLTGAQDRDLGRVVGWGNDVCKVKPSVFNGLLASGINDAFELEVNIDTLLVMKTGKTLLISPKVSLDGPISPDIFPQDSLGGPISPDIFPQNSLDGPISPEPQALGVYSVVILYVARMVGSGIFATPGIIFKECNSSVLLFSLVWCAGALVGYSGLAVYLELGSYLPLSGATKVFLEFIFPKPVYYWTVVFGFFTLFFTYCSTNAVVFGQYLRYSLGYEEDEAQSKKIAILLIVFGFLTHGINQRFGVLCQNIVGTLKLVVLSIMFFSTVWILNPFSTVDKIGWDGYSFSEDISHLKQNSGSLAILASAVLKSIYSFGGWTTAHTVQNEIKDPVRTIRKAAPLSFLSVFLLYGATIMAYFAVIPHEEIASSGNLVGVVLFKRVFGDILGQKILGFIISISAASNVLIVIFSDSRLYQEIASEGFIPFNKYLARNYSVLSYADPKGTPLVSLFYHCTLSIAVLVLPVPKGIYNFIIAMSIYPNQFFHAILCLGVFKLRSRFKYITAPLRSPSWLVILCFFFSTLIVLMPIAEVLLFGNYQNSAFSFASIAVLLVASLYWLIVVKLMPWFAGKKLRRVVYLMDGRKIKKVEYVRVS